MISREYHPIRRWLVLHLPGLIGADKRDKDLAKIWNSLHKTHPAWYRPVADVLLPDFGRILEELASASSTLATSVHLQDKLLPPPAYLENLRNRLVEAFLQRHQLSSDQLESTAEQSDEQRERLIARVTALPHGEAGEWDNALVSVDALLHFICHPWDQLSDLFPGKGGKADGRGLLFVDRLLDLYYVAEPVKVNPLLDLALREGFAAASAEALKPLRAGLAELFADQRFAFLIRGILAEPDFPLRRARYRPPSFSEALKELTNKFLAEARRRERKEQRKNLAQKVVNAFGNLSPVEFPQYNQKTSDFLTGKRLPELLHVDALQILATFQKGFAGMFGELFQGFQLEVDFVNEAKRQEFHNTLDDYYRMIDGLEKLELEFTTLSASTLGPVQTLIEQKFIDPKTQESAPNAVRHANERVDLVCRQGFRSLRKLRVLLSAYQLDSNSPAGKYFTGAAGLRKRFPAIFEKLERGVAILAKVLEVLELVVVDDEASSSV